MHRRLSQVLLLVLALTPIAAQAAPRDAAAKKKIDEAINTHYLTTDFEKAESVLLGTLSACEDRCSGPVRAQAWMYIGIVRGSGKADQAGALEAFQAAVAEDPNVQLDEALATPETIATFKKAKAKAGAGAPAAPATPATPVTPAAPAAPMAPAGPAMAGTMLCLPTVREVQTRRPVPLSCETPQPAVKGVIYYKEFGGDAWREVVMEKRGTSLQGMIPCEATSLAGKLQVYVEARDAAGNVVDVSGSQLTPIEFTVLGATNQPPPAYPGQEPPERCAEATDCPPDFPGCSTGKGDKAWGDSCASNDECQTGLCVSGSCDYCGSTADCSGGATCDDGMCKGGSTGAKGEVGPYKKLWLGLHGGFDVAVVSGNNVCMDPNWSCFYQIPPPNPAVANSENVWYPYATYPNGAGNVRGGATFATIRALLSFDYALAPKMLLGTRLGMAFNGGPAGNAKFFPLHAEGRFTYSFVSLDKKGFRPYVHLGGGLGQVDGKVPIDIYDCTWNNEVEQGYPLLNDPGYVACANGMQPTETDPVPTRVAMLKVDAYKRMGQLFVGPGFGVVYAIKPNLGVALNVDAKILLPTTGFAVSPSLGFVYGL